MLARANLPSPKNGRAAKLGLRKTAASADLRYLATFAKRVPAGRWEALKEFEFEEEIRHSRRGWWVNREPMRRFVAPDSPPPWNWPGEPDGPGQSRGAALGPPSGPLHPMGAEAFVSSGRCLR